MKFFGWKRISYPSFFPENSSSSLRFACFPKQLACFVCNVVFPLDDPCAVRWTIGQRNRRIRRTWSANCCIFAIRQNFFKLKREWIVSWKNVTKQWKLHLPGWTITRYVMIHSVALDWSTLAKLWYSWEQSSRMDLLVTWLPYQTLFQVCLQYI